MIPFPNRSERASSNAWKGAVLIALASVACASRSESLRFETASTAAEEEPRRPAGVAVDPAPELPPAASAASAEHGLMVLKTPLDTEAARQVVKEFFHAAVDSDAERLEKLMAEQAWVQGGAAMGRQQAQPFWRSRLSRLEYGSLAGQVVFRDAELEIYRSEDLTRLRPARSFGVAVQGDDVLVRVPIATPRVGRTRLFGDEITFLLRPTGSAFKIVEMVEDFQLP